MVQSTVFRGKISLSICQNDTVAWHLVPIFHKVSLSATKVLILSQTLMIMIQRVQTLFLLGVVAVTAAQFFFPLAGFISEFYYFKLYVHELRSMTPDTEPVFSEYYVLPLLVLHIIVGLISIITIFLYKRRIMQMRLVRLAFLVEIVFIALTFFYYIPQIEEQLNAVTDYTNSVGIYLPLVSLLFLMLALRFIRKDERLVRSADRLR